MSIFGLRAFIQSKKNTMHLAELSNQVSSFTSGVIYEHMRGASEMMGNTSYTAQLMGISEVINAAEDVEVNKISFYAACTTEEAYIEYRIFALDAYPTSSFVPANNTPIASGSLSVADTNHTVGQLQNIKLASNVIVPAGKYFTVFVKASEGKISYRRWGVDSETEPLRRRMLFKITGTWSDTISVGSAGYYTATFKVYKEIAGLTENSVEEPMLVTELQTKINNAAALPRIILPDEMVAVVGDTLQLFTRGIIEAQNPYNEPYEFISDVGNAYPRYFEFTPIANDVGTHALTVNIRHKSGDVAATASCNIVTVNPTGQPSAAMNILCVGDSLTENMLWPQEFYRRLTQSGGTPEGLEYENISFIGDTEFPNYPTQKAIGKGGWTFNKYMTDASSPFWDSDSSEFSFSAFCTANGYTSIDVMYVLLGWNGLSSPNKYLAADHAANIEKAKQFIDQLHSDYPNAIVRLLGLQIPSPIGGLGANYGATANYAYYGFLRSVNGWNLALQEMANDNAYSSFCKYVAIAPQFDSEYNTQQAVTAVNSRSAVTESRGTNGIHPDTTGYMQIADAVYRDFVRTFCSE